MSPEFALDYLVPLLPDFLARYPAVVPDWHFDNRQVDLKLLPAKTRVFVDFVVEQFRRQGLAKKFSAL